ncbi:hypothetical protein Rsub_11044 [Raphidocelis subcapitata]|uniref:Uncharacterized protein n=1 Tax=Raphidocelis subcapitata TaxID=307507 RepID=A0A2V0PEE7_9CHLO|nr:hypothetical protein Rsub_11044 [Raphidocelis subcapitata]|eukprot:GBF98224.1 hypothetical protein Rsub_11044 [Raphidocelis subcapitata]
MDDPLPGPLQPPEKLGEGGRKKKELLTRIAGRLEQQLHALQVVLAAEGAAHRRATARVEALQVILLARAALQQLLQQGDCPAPVLAALDTQALQLGTMCCGEELGSAAVLSSSGPSDRSTATTFRLQPSQQAPAAQAPLQRGGHHQQGQDHHRGPGPCMGASTSTATLQPSPAVVVAAAQPSAAEQAQAAAAAAAAAAATAATAAAATAAEEAAATSPSPDTAASAVPPPLAPPPPLPPRRPPPTAVGVPASVFIKRWSMGRAPIAQCEHA